MRTPTRDRQITSILAALVIHVIIVLMLGLIDLGQDITDENRLGPVAVRFEPEPPDTLPQPAEPPEPEEPEEPPAEAQDAQEPQAPAAESQAPQGPQESQTSAAEPQQQESPPREAAAEEEWSIPTPSGREIPDMEQRRAPREPSTEQPPASRSLEGRTDQSVAPEQQAGSSEGSRIAYAEEEAPESTESDRRQPDSGRSSGESQEGARSVFSEELMQDLESVQAAEEGPAEGDAEGGDGSATGATSLRTEEGGQVVYALEGDDSSRDLLQYSLPQLSQEELSGLPGRVEVVVSFTLPPNGRPMDLQIERSSGRIPVDVKVERAVQTWEFSDAPQDAEPVKGGARIIIRAAD